MRRCLALNVHDGMKFTSFVGVELMGAQKGIAWAMEHRV